MVLGKRKTKQEFIYDAMNIHGDKYDYSESVYINNKTEIKIICKEERSCVLPTPRPSYTW